MEQNNDNNPIVGWPLSKAQEKKIYLLVYKSNFEDLIFS